MRGMATLIILMSLYLILLFGSPFSGDLKVSPEPFKTMVRIGMYYKKNVNRSSKPREDQISEKPTIERTNNVPTMAKPKSLHSR
jgi:hypothetical protein